MTCTGSDLIAAERQRQIAVEGYDAQHDAGHSEELAQAGATYAQAGRYRGIPQWDHTSSEPPFSWPWQGSDWKPTPGDRIRELVKAGALIAAAIDALQPEAEGEGR